MSSDGVADDEVLTLQSVVAIIRILFMIAQFTPTSSSACNTPQRRAATVLILRAWSYSSNHRVDTQVQVRKIMLYPP